MSDPPSTPPLPTPSPSQFPKHDASEAAFWDVRFGANFTPWDHAGVPVLFRDYVTRQQVKRSTLIPGCGTGHEVAALVANGWDVKAIDFSAEAVLRAKQVLGPLASHVEQRDFFDATLAEKPFGMIYERAFLCALPARMRDDWANQVAKLLAPSGRLVGFFYFDDNPKGPPFGITRDALLELLITRGFVLIDEQTPTDSIAVFAGKERWMVWEKL
jgi:SAM-dependent methyltransferase